MSLHLYEVFAILSCCSIPIICLDSQMNRNSNDCVYVRPARRYFGNSSQSKQQKKEKPQASTSTPKEEKSTTNPSIFQKLWASLQANTATATSDDTAKTDTSTDDQSKEDGPDWASMYADIKESNQFTLLMNDMSTSEWTEYQTISGSEFMHKFLMKINFFPLKFEEFMCGSHQGMQFVLKCLQQEDMESLKSVMDEEAMGKLQDLKKEMMDEEYSEVGKIMSFLNTVNHAPNFQETSLQAQYFVRYYYQLKIPKVEKSENECNEQETTDVNDEEQGADAGKEEQPYIVKRCDVTWSSVWLPEAGWTHKISEKGWRVQDITHVSELKAT